jgi:hypothetical protein
MTMRPLRFILAALAALAAFAPSAGQADPYPWCAQYGGGDRSGGRNCGFVTWEQCMASVRGIGGFCETNPFYTGPATTGAARPRTTRKPKYN